MRRFGGVERNDSLVGALETGPPQSKSLIAVVDDDQAVLRSLTRLLTVHGYETKAYSRADSLLAEIMAREPDCVIADLAMPGLNGFDLQRTLADFEIEFPVVFITGFGDIRSSVRAMREGAVDFLAKPIEPADLLDAVERALVRSRCARELAQKRALFCSRLATLTARERDVFELVVAGQLNKQIAASLGIAEKTVKVHRARVMQKMSVKSVAGLARVAERLGVGSPLR